MNKLIDFTFFIRSISVAQVSLKDVRDNLELYIDLYGLEFLTILLGESLAAEFLQGLAEEEPLQKWVDLKNILVDEELKVSPIANYVFTHLLEDEITQNSGIGVVRTKGENSTEQNPTTKIIIAWNAMARMVCPMHRKIRAMGFPNYAHKNRETICKPLWSSCCLGSNQVLFPYRNRFGL